MRNDRRQVFVVFTLLAAGALAGSPVWAQTNIAVWNFEAQNTVPSVDLNGGAAATGGPGLSSESYFAGNGSVYAWSFANWSTGPLDTTKYFQFRVTSLNNSGLNLAFAERRSGTGPRDFEVHYSTDGSSFTQLATTVTNVPDDTAFRTHSFDLSSVTALNNQANLYLRIYGYNAEGTTGTWRVDDVTISMATVPVELQTFSVE